MMLNSVPERQQREQRAHACEGSVERMVIG